MCPDGVTIGSVGKAAFGGGAYNGDGGSRLDGHGSGVRFTIIRAQPHHDPKWIGYLTMIQVVHCNLSAIIERINDDQWHRS